MMSVQEAGGERLFGVSLEDLARVHAAERAGVAAEERLAELGLSRVTFSRAEQAWSERLAVSLRGEPSLFVAYDSALAAALRSEAPKILPLEEELTAWISFEGHFQRAADPAELVKRCGLTLMEVASLHRLWAARLAADPALAAEAAAKRAEEPLPLPEIRREPRRPAAARPAPVLRAVPAPEQPPRAPAALSSQMETVEVKPLAASLPAVPFAGRAPDAEAIWRAKEHAEKVQPAAGAVSMPAAVGETAPVDIRALSRNVLAFDALKAPAPPAPVSHSAAPVPPAQTAPLGQTAPLSVNETAPIDITALARSVLAFDPPRPPAAPSAGQGLPFSLEEYAAVSAELSLHPEKSAAIWARVGVRDSRAAAAITAQLNARINAEPAFRQSWQAAYSAHRARLAGAKR